MENEILEELWEIKDKISENSNFNIETLAKKLRKKELKEKSQIFDLTTESTTQRKKTLINQKKFIVTNS